ncbi:MAG: type II toxin-antitoxin system VapC family toxin [Pseudonocardiaceae bacterium]
MKVVLDTSALLAWLRGEPGAEVVHPLLPTAIMSAANWSEACQKLHQRGVDAEKITDRLRTLGVQVEPLTEADAAAAANLWSQTRAAGLSLGDRCCLALGARLNLTTVTADTTWADLDLDIPLQIIR